MGKKTRIVLLTVTAVLAVFVFSAMWTVRPGTHNAVLEAARARQNEPLLSVAEPLETDVKALSEEERMAEEVAALLSADDAFISSLAAAIADEISLDSYIPELTEAVYSRVAEDYDTHREELTRDIVMEILREYDALSTAEKARVLSLEDMVLMLYGAYRDDLAADIAAALALESLDAEDAEALTAEAIEAIAARMYEENKDRVAEDTIAAAIAGYDALTAEGKASLLDAEAIAAVLAERCRDEIAAYIPDLVEHPEALGEDDVRAIAEALYGEYADYIASDIASRIPSSAASVEEPEEEPLPEVVIPEAAPKTPISVPVFSAEPVVPQDSGADEYRAARDAQRRAEIDKALAFIAD